MDEKRFGRLIDKEILYRLTHPVPEKRIIITPIFSIDEQLGPAGIDLRLSNQFISTETSSHTHLDPFDSDSAGAKTRFLKTHYSDDPFVLHPSELVLGCTLEYIKVPKDLQAKINGRSAWGREGVLVHLTAEEIHPGSEGVITFELLNAGHVPIEIHPGMRISHLSFEQLSGVPLRTYEGREAKFFRNLEPTKGKLGNDPELQRIKAFRDKTKKFIGTFN